MKKMKNKNNLPILLLLLSLLCMAGLAGATAWLQWQSGLLLEEADRALALLEKAAGQETAQSALPAGRKDEDSFAAEDLPSEREDGSEGEGLSESMSDSDAAEEGLSEARSAPDGRLRAGAKSDGFFTDLELALAGTGRHHMIFVGDSRTVGMGKAEEKTGDSCVYIGEPGEGYNWFTEFGIDLLDEAIRANPGDPVVYNFGVNDCDAVNAYIEVYREIEKGYPDTRFYYMSVNPVTKESPNVPLSDVLAFNRSLKAAFPDQYIDTCTWMLRKGYEDVDGVHYSGKQYRKIHNYAVLAVRKMEEKEKEEETSTVRSLPASPPDSPQQYSHSDTSSRAE